MDLASLRKLLKDLYDRRTDPEAALERLKDLPYEDLGFARIDHHRHLRRGAPEVIYCQGKTLPQIVSIVKAMLTKGNNVLATRASSEVYEAIREIDQRANYNELGRTVTIRQSEGKPTDGLALVITAGTSDIPVAEEAAVTAEMLGSRVDRLYDVGVAGIHRLLDRRDALLEARVIVVVAGMDGALASVIGGLVDKPIIAVPTSVGYGASFGGVAALLTMLNSCASGVATVNIDNGFGAGYIAHTINLLGEKGA